MDKTVFVARNKRGGVVSVALAQDEMHAEALPADSPELMEFGQLLQGEEAKFVASDLALVRVIEDLIEVLIQKDVLRFTDLPAAAQHKLMERKSLRGLNLLEDSDNGII